MPNGEYDLQGTISFNDSNVVTSAIKHWGWFNETKQCNAFINAIEALMNSSEGQVYIRIF